MRRILALCSLLLLSALLSSPARAQVSLQFRDSTGAILATYPSAGCAGAGCITVIFKQDPTASVTFTPSSNTVILRSAAASGVGATQAGVQTESYTYAADTGAVNAYAIALTPTPALVPGSIASFLASHTNTGPSTLAVNGATAVPITKNGATVLAAGDITSGQIIAVIYDGTQFQMIGGGAGGGGGGGLPSIPATKFLYVDKNRVDSYTADGSVGKPFKTIAAAVSQIITNADNSATVPYTIRIATGIYPETVDLGNAALILVNFEGSLGTIVSGASGTGDVFISKTANALQLGGIISNVQLGLSTGTSYAIDLEDGTNGGTFGNRGFRFQHCVIFEEIKTLNLYGGALFRAFMIRDSEVRASPITITNGSLVWQDNYPSGTASFNLVGAFVEFHHSAVKGSVNVDATSQVDLYASDVPASIAVTAGGLVFNHGSLLSGTNTFPAGSYTTDGPSGLIAAWDDVTYTSAAIGPNLLYTETSGYNGIYRVSWVAKIVTPATTSSVLGGANGFQVQYTDADDSVVVTPLAVPNALATGNSTNTQLSGSVVLNVAGSSNVNYSFDYTSVGGTAMQYSLHVKLERLQ